MATHRSDLEVLGFDGFVSFAELPLSNVPTGAGVYSVVRQTIRMPEFLPKSPASHHKRRDATVASAILTAAWVDNVEVVYFGKATAGADGLRGLRKRLEEYRRHGAGEAAGHWGGRYIWQLSDSADLLVAWLPIPYTDPGDEEARLIAAFHAKTGSLPFANLNRGRARPVRLTYPPSGGRHQW